MDWTRERSRPFAIACWLLTAAFAARVIGQALQTALPQPFLPSAERFQGSALPYAVLLASQLAILWFMLRYTLRLHHGALVAARRAGVLLAALGGAYLAVAVGRIAVGLALPSAPAWFSAWIPATFHVVLATYVLTLAAYHLSQGRTEAR